MQDFRTRVQFPPSPPKKPEMVWPKFQNREILKNLRFFKINKKEGNLYV